MEAHTTLTVASPLKVYESRLSGNTIFCFQNTSYNRFVMHGTRAFLEVRRISLLHNYLKNLGLELTGVVPTIRLSFGRRNDVTNARQCLIEGSSVVFHALTFAGSGGSCLNTRPLGRVFKYLPRDPANVIAMK